jgi:hypothetical protein
MTLGPNRFYEPSNRLQRTSCSGRTASLRRPEGRTSCYPSPSWFLSAATPFLGAAERDPGESQLYRLPYTFRVLAAGRAGSRPREA